MILLTNKYKTRTRTSTHPETGERCKIVTEPTGRGGSMVQHTITPNRQDALVIPMHIKGELHVREVR